MAFIVFKQNQTQTFTSVGNRKKRKLVTLVTDPAAYWQAIPRRGRCIIKQPILSLIQQAVFVSTLGQSRHSTFEKMIYFIFFKCLWNLKIHSERWQLSFIVELWFHVWSSGCVKYVHTLYWHVCLICMDVCVLYIIYIGWRMFSWVE